MTDNIYQILSTHDINEILKKYSNTLVVILYTSRKLKYKQSKKNLLKDSLQAPECMFLYVEQENIKFMPKEIPLEQMPLFMFFYQGQNFDGLRAYIEPTVIPKIRYLQNIIMMMQQVSPDNQKDNVSNVSKKKPSQEKQCNLDEDKNNVVISKVKDTNTNTEEKEILKKILETNEKCKELEQLEALLKLKKIKTLQEFDGKSESLSGASSKQEQVNNDLTSSDSE